MGDKDLEAKLREDFRKALYCNKCGNVVDDLIAILKRDYVLLVKEPLYCRDCLHFHTTYGWLSHQYCMYYRQSIDGKGSANNCEHYCSGEDSARKSMARFHNELTGDLFYDG